MRFHPMMRRTGRQSLAAILGGVAAFALAAPAARGQWQLEGSINATILGYTPYEVAVADFNGDGWPDAATANVSSAGVSVLLNNLAGSLVTFPEDVPLTAASRTISAANLNGDARPDLVVGLSDNSIQVLLNDTGAGFTAGQRIDLTAEGANPASVTLGDIDGDTDNDLIVGMFGPYIVRVYKNNGSGVFTSSEDIDTSNLSIYQVVLADMDNDTDLDILVQDAFGVEFRVLVNNGSGAFTTSASRLVSFTEYSIAAADFDGDGLRDVVAANNYGGSVSVFKNLGSLAFADPADYPTAPYPYWVRTADVNGDGKPDIVTANNTSASVSVLQNTTVGGAISFGSPQNLSVGPNPVALSIADFDRDSRPDVITANSGAQTLSVLYGESRLGGGTRLAGGISSSFQGTYPTFLAEGRLNADNRPDIVFSSGAQFFVSLAGTGGRFDEPTAYYSGAGIKNTVFDVALGDFDGDTDADVVAADYTTGTVSLLKNDGTGALGAPVSFAVGAGPYRMAAGDLDGDTDLDLAVANSNEATVTLLRNDGTGVFATLTTLATTYANYAPVIADLDDDGDMDIAAIGGGPEIALFRRNLDGTYTTMTPVPTTTSGVDLVAGHFDRDGLLDLATADYGAAGFSVVLSQGGFAFGAPASYPIGGYASSIHLADLTSDGVPDLVTTINGSYEGPFLSAGIGDGTFAPAVNYGGNANAYDLAIADFNQDGMPDVLVGDTTFGRVVVLPNSAPQLIDVEIAGPLTADVTYFSEEIDLATLIPANFTVTGTGLGTLTAQPDSVTPIGASTGARLTWTSGEMRIDGSLTITGGAGIKDRHGNILYAHVRTQTTDNNAQGVRPTVISITPETAGPTSATTLFYTLEFSEAITGLGQSDISILATGDFGGGFVSDVTQLDGDTWTVLLGDLSGDASIRIRVNDSTFADLAGNTNSGASADSPATIIDNTLPAASAPTDPGATTISTNVLFEWAAPTDTNGIASVFLEVGTAPGTSNVLSANVTGSTSRIVPGAVGQTLYARLIVTDNVGLVTTTESSDGITIEAESPGRSVGDFDNDGCTGINDFLFLLDNWQIQPAGFNSILDVTDFLALLDNWMIGPNC